MDETELFTLRWKGKTVGPLSRVMLQEKLQNGELSLAHEIKVQEQWMPLRKFLSADLGLAKVNPTMIPISAPADEKQTYTMRWRGKTLGPYSQAVIFEKLQTGELSLAHEIRDGENWCAVRCFLGRHAQPQKPEQPTVHPSPPQAPEQPAAQPVECPPSLAHTEQASVEIAPAFNKPKLKLLFGQNRLTIHSPITTQANKPHQVNSASDGDVEAIEQKAREHDSPTNHSQESDHPSLKSNDPIDKLKARLRKKP